MRAIQVSRSGPPAVLQLVRVKDPEPAAGEVLIRVELAGITYGDTIVRAGRYPFPKPAAEAHAVLENRQNIGALLLQI